MKIQIEIDEPINSNIKSATFSLELKDVPVLNMAMLSKLNAYVEQAYCDFYKMKTGEDMSEQLLEFIRNNPRYSE